ncbi:DUF1444 family protein [Petrocella sp. FN5]|uniref:DUF1444 family protein n=1 Tax=Petrocella sp. FN5 TaxID=3032002 RepID=UPI0023DC0CB2|nr:DUF1444 family protein [Petrocella sp. FN5]MDF1618198.1 DUF1444 family protein [Petrocella sp. FN5]
MLTFDNYALKLLEDLSHSYEHTHLDNSGNHIRILCDGYIVELVIKELFLDYKANNNYVAILNRILTSITEFENTDDGKIDLDKVYPLVRNHQDIVDEPDWLYTPYFLNLNICYVQETGMSKRLLTKHLLEDYKTINLVKIHEAAYENLTKTQWTLSQPDKDYDIYMVHGNGYSGSLLYLNELLDQVKSKLGETFLTAMPHADLLLFTEDNMAYAKMLKTIIRHDPLPNTSRLLYRYNKDTFYYYDMNDIIKVVK